jgi:hypothetical protein
MVECIARLEETASQTLKDQITATGPYRYRLEGIACASLHIKTIEFSIKNLENIQRIHSPATYCGGSESVWLGYLKRVFYQMSRFFPKKGGG